MDSEEFEKKLAEWNRSLPVRLRRNRLTRPFGIAWSTIANWWHARHRKNGL